MSKNEKVKLKKKSKTSKGIVLYTEKELISFGNYVLSEKRSTAIVHGCVDRVHDADLDHWKNES